MTQLPLLKENSGMNNKPVKIIAHRGNSSFAPENTRASFQQAIDLGVDYIECDIQVTNDGIPVILHDPTINEIDVKTIRWQELREIDIGSWFDKAFQNERILSLEEFLQIPKGNVGSMIEIKEATYISPIHTHTVKQVISSCSNASNLVIGSLSVDVVKSLEKEIPSHQTIAIPCTIKDLDHFLTTQAKIFALHEEIATKEVISDLQKRGKEVWAWTVDDESRAKRLIQDGIQGIITNRPKTISTITV